MASRTLRITLLASEWKSSKGGLSTMNRELAIHLAKHPSVSVSFLVPECSDKDKREAGSCNVKIVEAEERPGFEPVVWLAFPPKDLATDFVIGHGVILGKQAQIIRGSHHCKWIQVVHTAPEELAMYKAYSDAIPKGGEKQWNELKLCRIADRVVAVGPKLHEFYSAYLSSSGKDVYNFTPGIFTELSILKVSSQMGKKFRILVFGRGDSEDFELKGFDIAAQAVAKLNDKSYYLTFVGAPSGNETQVRNELLKQGLCRSQLIVKGYLENREYLNTLLCASNLAIVPSRTEGFGLTALEALSAGLPFLVSHNSGFGEAIQDIGSSFIVDSEDPEHWAEAIKGIREKGSEAALQECRKLRARYAEKYSWETQCNELLDMMLNLFQEDLLTKSSPARLKHSQGMETDTSSVRGNMAILYRNQSDIVEAGTKEESQKCFHLFNCDMTCKLDSVEMLLKDIEEKLSFKISVKKHYFNRSQMSEMCDSIKSELQMDFAFFVVHAQESRLSINEENAGIGYAKIYKALLEKTGEKVIIVIGSDVNYKDADEEQSSVLSRWAYHKVSSQFDEQFVDGRKSFIFSWDKEHRPIHEEALLHYFDPKRKGKKCVSKFVPVEPKGHQVDPNKAVKSQENTETDVKAEPERNLLKIETQTPDGQKTQTRSEEEKIPNQDPLQTDETQPHIFEFLTPEIEEPMDLSEDFIYVGIDDQPKEDPLSKSGTARLQQSQAMEADNSPLRVNTAILYRDHSDIDVIKEVFGETIREMAPVTMTDPSDLNDFLSSQTVSSCFITVEAVEVVKEIQKKSRGTPYEDLLRKARNTVETKVVTILCNESNKITRGDEDAVTTRIDELLEGKGVILWWKGNKSPLQTRRSPFTRSQYCPSRRGAATTNTKKIRPINPEEFTLILQTRLHHGNISYEKEDVKCRMPEGWTAPKEIENALSVKWRSTIDAELLIYRENKTGDLRTKVMSEDKDTQLSRMGDSVKEILQTVRSYPLPSRPQISFVGGSSTSATTEAEYIDIKHEDVPKEEPFPLPNPADLQYFQAVDTDTSPLRVSMAILYRDRSDISVIKDVFGEALRGIAPFTLNDPTALTDFLSAQTVRSCFVIVEAGEIIKEIQKKSRGTPYEDLLRKARNSVETKVVTILCNEGNKITRGDEDAVTTRIDELLESKGVIVWWKGNKSSLQTRPSQLTRSQSCPSRKDAATKTTKKGRPINPEELIYFNFANPSASRQNFIRERRRGVQNARRMDGS